ncbi:sugar ABC transporter permease [Ferroacidibacillus organovorans]|uniref:Sugar ABC transporter permease n=2 Tax=Ferroacidibacillus organovorans TaxID=1765683 RepID=A0A162SMD3_9BACL|nr:sugar ABC transporter permease [Ferroacidibacillus organovorans]OAG92885.1 sugar ABC transporter permease [Ferroacidibacillus organovorans]OPG16141.1 sugar ABC transporter permease [Ferroacidibacillus organovorans]
MKRRRITRSAVDQALAGYLFVLPALASLVIFLLGPIIYSFYISFQHFNYLDPQAATWAGLDNYLHLFVDPVFLQALWNTSLYTLIVVPVQTALSLFLALIVERIRGKSFFRVAYYLPSVTSSVAVSVMFVFIFGQTGLLNNFLSIFGIQGPNWLNNPSTALLAVMMIGVWTTVGQFMIIYLSGLQSIPEDVYEAASIDGAGGVSMLRYITVPLLRRTTFLIVVMGMIGTFQLFDTVDVISNGQGGPIGSTMTVVLDIFNKAFRDMAMGYAAAMSFFLFVIILILTLIQNFVLGRENQ